MEIRGKVALIAENPINRYSGGRIHALWLAFAFAANGYDVDYYTNAIPVFWNDMPQHLKCYVHFKISRYFMWKARNNKYRCIVLVPHLASWKSDCIDNILFYPFSSKLKKKNSCQMWYLDFESPNWIKETDPTLRSMAAYRNSNKILKDCDIVLSTTKTGMSYAKEYYLSLNHELIFHQLYLSINTYAAKGIEYKSKSDLFAFFARFGQKHKNNEAIFNIIGGLPQCCELAVFGNPAAAKPLFIARLEEQCKAKKIALCFHKNVTDRDKFKILARCKVVFFSSKFEGYGIPPLEAQFMGASVVSSDLPVLREVNKKALFVDFDNTSMLNETIRELIEHPQNPEELRSYVESFASPQKFFDNLREITNKEL